MSSWSALKGSSERPGVWGLGSGVSCPPLALLLSSSKLFALASLNTYSNFPHDLFDEMESKKHGRGCVHECVFVINGWTLNPDTHVPVGNPKLNNVKNWTILSISLICVKAQLHCPRSFWLTWAQKCSQVVQWTVPPTHTCVGQSYRHLHHSRTSFTSPLPSSTRTEPWHLS